MGHEGFKNSSSLTNYGMGLKLGFSNVRSQIIPRCQDHVLRLSNQLRSQRGLGEEP